jgi:hypothetical protein
MSSLATCQRGYLDLKPPPRGPAYLRLSFCAKTFMRGAVTQHGFISVCRNEKVLTAASPYSFVPSRPLSDARAVAEDAISVALMPAARTLSTLGYGVRRNIARRCAVAAALTVTARALADLRLRQWRSYNLHGREQNWEKSDKEFPKCEG